MVPSLRESTDELLVPADVLGAFGVTPADLGSDPSDGDGLEAALADALSTGVDRRTVLRRTITRSDRGLSCPARYSAAELESELADVFGAMNWSLAVSHAKTDPELTATDPRGRRCEASIAYPDTPLGSNNLPAVLWTTNDAILAGTGARFVLLSAGVDRWRAALIETSELGRLRDRYGPRIEAVDRPLCPEDELEAYVPAATADDASGSEGEHCGTDGDDPWPPWALERNADQSLESAPSVDALIDEAEPSARSEPDAETASKRTSSDAPAASPSSTSPDRSTASTPEGEIDGFELRGTPAVSRRGDDDRSGNEWSETAGFDDAGKTTSSDDGATTADEFGTLSGGSETARIDNDSFGTAVEPQSEDDRYRALGAALDAGGNVSVRGLLEDDEFLPELPATGTAEIRIEFADGCAPVTVPEATATTERSGFEWVDTGSLETVRASDQ